MTTPTYYRGPLGLVNRATDALAGVLSPTWQARRMMARDAARLGYDAAQAKRTRRTIRSTGSGDSDLLPDLVTLRDNARTMVRDDANAAALMRVLLENVVGTGLVPQGAVVGGQATGWTQQQADDWNGQAEEVFNAWADDEADATEHTDFAGLQQQVLREMVRDGEHLSHRLVVTGGRPRRIRSAVELIDVDRLVTPIKRDQADVRGGVEIGARSQPLAYWITPRHPADLPAATASERLRKNQPERWARWENGYLSILHTFERERAGQHRGVPMFASSFGLIEALNDIVESETVAARAAARICLLVKQTAQTSWPGLQQQPQGEWHEKLDAGTIKYLNPGEDAVPFVPNRPGNTWAQFCNRVLRSVCSSFGLPLEMVARDWAAMSYSGMRGALNEAHRGFGQWQQRLEVGFLRKWWAIVITEAVDSGVLAKPPRWDLNRRAYLAHTWVPPSWGYVDPTKEIQAEREAIAANLTTPQAAAQRQGGDSEANLRARARHLVRCRELEEANGLEPGSLSSMLVQPAPAAAVQPAAPAGQPPGGQDPAQPGDQPQDATPQDQPQDPNQ